VCAPLLGETIARCVTGAALGAVLPWLAAGAVVLAAVVVGVELAPPQPATAMATATPMHTGALLRAGFMAVSFRWWRFGNRCTGPGESALST
jgi:hypothetical protein